MSQDAVIGRTGSGRIEAATSVGRSDSMRPAPVTALLVAGLILGILGDGLLRVPGPPGLNFFLWVASVAVAAVVLQRRTGLSIDSGRAGWLGLAALFAAGFAWRDSEPLKPLALGCVTLAFALAAYRL